MILHPERIARVIWDHLHPTGVWHLLANFRRKQYMELAAIVIADVDSVRPDPTPALQAAHAAILALRGEVERLSDERDAALARCAAWEQNAGEIGR